ncbi:RNase adaptor protein RapZ [Halorhodospira halochloris]|nr:RNase adaptor protein RapZ [Halorhodospira halochloris]
MRLIVVSGLSGSGKSVALNTLEDAGFYCIDNLPVNLIADFALFAKKNHQRIGSKFAVGIDARNPKEDLVNLPQTIEYLQQTGITTEAIFLYADDYILMRRYSETRRRHPLAQDGRPLSDSLKDEKAVLEPLRERADWTIDTSRTSVHDLRSLVYERLGGDRPTLAILVQSFGFKHGIPTDADYVFDARCLPNPHWVPELRASTGQHVGVCDFLENHPETETLYNQILGIIAYWLPTYKESGRSYLTVAIGCTGGQHRSVYLAERLANDLAEQCSRLTLRHRELP